MGEYAMRQYIQYNEFVFDAPVEEVSDADFLDDTTEYTGRHGGYSSNRMLVRPRELSFTLFLKMYELPCEYRDFYRDFVIAQLSEPGKLWAVQDGTLLWTNAKLKKWSEQKQRLKDTLEIDVIFTLLEGIWHKANLLTTFMKPFDKCDFMECYGFKKIDPCKHEEHDCCNCSPEPIHTLGCDCCECIQEDWAACYHQSEYKSLDCSIPFRLVHSCGAGDKYFPVRGQKFCGTCGYIADHFYANTDLMTKRVRLHFIGEITDPNITINDNTNIIRGTFKDLVVHPNGTAESCGCTLPVDAWVVPEGNSYKWDVRQGMNRLVIDACCGPFCVYVEVDPITL